MIHPKYGYKISQGDTLRFGKVRFKVKKVSGKQDDKSSLIHPLESWRFFDTQYYSEDKGSMLHNYNYRITENK